ncbi:MAG TPA: cytochrome P450, partial [Stenomitos sp.]
GGGARRCIGVAFALMEMKQVLAVLLSKYRFELTDQRPITPVRRGVTLAPPGNLRLRFLDPR